VIEDAHTYRSKEQVLVDLAKALGFSAASLEANRQGKLTSEQIRQFAVRVITPAVLTLVWAVLPFLIWAAMISSQKQVSLSEGLSIFFTRLLHLGQLVEANGKFGAFLRMGSTLAGLVGAGFCAFRVSLPLYFDLLGREVVKKEGRVVAREEQTLRPSGRDPIEKFFFNLRNDYYPVNLPAYRALENGSIYILYVLPRSNVLVSIEPKVDASESAGETPGSKRASSTETASSTEPASSIPAA
jgi:hypothetical protein